MTFSYIVNKDKKYVIALARSDGKTIRAKAKCSPKDEFDEELGKKIASARCKVKILDKQYKSSCLKYDSAKIEFDNAKHKKEKALEFCDNCFEEFETAFTELNNLMRTI